MRVAGERDGTGHETDVLVHPWDRAQEMTFPPFLWVRAGPAWLFEHLRTVAGSFLVLLGEKMGVREWELDVDRYLNRVLPASPLHRFPVSISRFLGYRKEQSQDVGNVLGAFWALVGAFCGLSVVAAVFNNTGAIHARHPPALIASFVRLLDMRLREIC